jgi:hypothetical protein
MPPFRMACPPHCAISRSSSFLWPLRADRRRGLPQRGPFGPGGGRHGPRVGPGRPGGGVMCRHHRGQGADAAFLAEHITDMLQEPGEFGLDRIARLLVTFAGQKQWYSPGTVFWMSGAEGRRSGWTSARTGRVACKAGAAGTNPDGPFLKRAPGLLIGKSMSRGLNSMRRMGESRSHGVPCLRYSRPCQGAGRRVRRTGGPRHGRPILLDRLRQAAVAALWPAASGQRAGYWLLAPSPIWNGPSRYRDGLVGTTGGSLARGVGQDSGPAERTVFP